MFVRVVYVCMLFSETKTRTWLSTNTVSLRQIFATVLKFLSPKCLPTLFVLFSDHFHDVRGR